MKFEIHPTKVETREPVAYLAHTHLWIKVDEGGYVCLCSEEAVSAKAFYEEYRDLTGARDYKEFYEGDSITITF